MEVDARNNMSDEPQDGEQHMDPGIVGAATRVEWIMVLERGAPQADLNTNNGFDVSAVTLRTVTMAVVSVVVLVASGHKVIFRGQDAELSTAGGAVAPLMRIRGLW